jgi:hypothetical protein
VKPDDIFIALQELTPRERGEFLLEINQTINSS